MAGVLGSNVVPVVAEVVDIPYMPGWPALLVLVVVLLVVGLRNPYRKMTRGRASEQGRHDSTVGRPDDEGPQGPR